MLSMEMERETKSHGGSADGIRLLYVPMRDLFTSPAVSFAYERGWRQGFAQAGFPGADSEYQMAKDYFTPAVVESRAVVDMSCATGTCRLFRLHSMRRLYSSDAHICFLSY